MWTLLPAQDSLFARAESLRLDAAPAKRAGCILSVPQALQIDFPSVARGADYNG
jgi:hypothetical protein